MAGVATRASNTMIMEHILQQVLQQSDPQHISTNQSGAKE